MLTEIQSDICLFMKSFLYHAGLDVASTSIMDIVYKTAEWLNANKDILEILKSDCKKDMKLFKQILQNIFAFLLDIITPCKGLYKEVQEYITKLKAVKSIKNIGRIIINIQDFFQMIANIIQALKDKLYPTAGELSAKFINQYIFGFKNDQYHILSDIIIGMLRSRGVPMDEAQSKYGNFHIIQEKGVNDDGALEPLIDGISQIKLSVTASNEKEIEAIFLPYFSLFIDQLKPLDDEYLAFKTIATSTMKNWNDVIAFFENTNYEDLGLKLGKIFK
jgi:hypothetical protein